MIGTPTGNIAEVMRLHIDLFCSVNHIGVFCYPPTQAVEMLPLNCCAAHMTANTLDLFDSCLVRSLSERSQAVPAFFLG